jgi:hypothetical protein
MDQELDIVFERFRDFCDAFVAWFKKLREQLKKAFEQLCAFVREFNLTVNPSYSGHNYNFDYRRDPYNHHRVNYRKDHTNYRAKSK